MTTSHLVLTDPHTDFEENLVTSQMNEHGDLKLFFAKSRYYKHEDETKSLYLSTVEELQEFIEYLEELRRKMIEVKYKVELK